MAATETVGVQLPLRTQLVRFVITGGLSAIVDFGTYQLMLQLDVYIHLAKAISFVLGTTTAYLINRRWTFQSLGGRGQFAAVLLLYAATFAAQIGVNALVLLYVEHNLVGTTLAYVVAQGTATVINFVVQRMVIFKTPAAAPAVPAD
ncbi:GtrA family protein [Rhodococcus sp. X156]|uniref:GtrA family protein n=1 Tax=Rhodococcus sp. X156 TaxID=2499145 RepID=UPI001F495538|nr:GtrA family protein [Rhodococcus sp. X156]